MTGESSLLFEKMHKAYDIKVDKILFPFISNILKIILLAILIIIIADNKIQYKIVYVDDWIENDDSLQGDDGY